MKCIKLLRWFNIFLNNIFKSWGISSTKIENLAVFITNISFVLVNEWRSYDMLIIPHKFDRCITRHTLLLLASPLVARGYTGDTPAELFVRLGQFLFPLASQIAAYVKVHHSLFSSSSSTYSSFSSSFSFSRHLFLILFYFIYVLRLKYILPLSFYFRELSIIPSAIASFLVQNYRLCILWTGWRLISQVYCISDLI